MKYRNAAIAFLLACAGFGFLALPGRTASKLTLRPGSADAQVASAGQAFDEGRRTFRFDTFGDQAFWGDNLKLHQAIEGNKSVQG